LDWAARVRQFFHLLGYALGKVSSLFALGRPHGVKLLDQVGTAVPGRRVGAEL
jgi:hypothetical protein